MKLSKIITAIAATAIGATAIGTAAQDVITGGDMNLVATNLAASHVSAVAIIGPTPLIDGLRIMQDFPAGCAGSVSALCAPSISSAELRAILTNNVANLSFIQGGGSDLATEANISAKSAGISEYAAGGVIDALRAFNGSDTVNNIKCGQSSIVQISNATSTDADTIAGQSGASFGFVHATELDGSVGFIKLDGVAPSLVALLSSNYNLVSNLNSAGSAVDKSVNGITVGVTAASGGVASHSPIGCSTLNTGSPIADVNGGGI